MIKRFICINTLGINWDVMSGRGEESTLSFSRPLFPDIIVVDFSANVILNSWWSKGPNEEPNFKFFPTFFEAFTLSQVAGKKYHVSKIHSSSSVYSMSCQLMDIGCTEGQLFILDKRYFFPASMHEPTFNQRRGCSSDAPLWKRTQCSFDVGPCFYRICILYLTASGNVECTVGRTGHSIN